MAKTEYIMIVEDDPLIVRLYKNIFETAGYAVDWAGDGEEAIAKLNKASAKPSVVLLDIMMPKMNGMEALKKMKETGDLKHIPVVMLTNLAGEEDAKNALALGATAYLVKSEYEPKEVVAKIEAIIKNNRE